MPAAGTAAPIAGEPLPSLQAVARYMQRNGYALNIEIKPTPGQERDTGRVVAQEAARLWAGQHAAAADLVRARRAGRRARNGAPQLPRGLLIDRCAEGWIDAAQRLECVAVVQLVRAARRRADRAAARRRAARAGLHGERPAPRRTGSPALGIDGLITDAVDRFSPAGLLLD